LFTFTGLIKAKLLISVNRCSRHVIPALAETSNRRYNIHSSNQLRQLKERDALNLTLTLKTLL